MNLGINTLALQKCQAILYYLKVQLGIVDQFFRLDEGLTAIENLYKMYIDLFGLLKKKSRVEVLQVKYTKLLKEAHDLSKYNRTLSDRKYSAADDVSVEVGRLLNQNLSIYMIFY